MQCSAQIIGAVKLKEIFKINFNEISNLESSIMSLLSSTKSRREVFEEQLKDLQKDISSLSQKLSVPNIITTSRFASSPCKSYYATFIFSNVYVVSSGHNLQSSNSGLNTSFYVKVLLLSRYLMFFLYSFVF
jgi:hypothetical protein